MFGPILKGVRLAASPKGRRMIKGAVVLAQTPQGRRVLSQARKVATSPEGRRLLDQAVKAAGRAGKSAAGPKGRDRIAGAARNLRGKRGD
jgi:hypothetical protein